MSRASVLVAFLAFQAMGCSCSEDPAPRKDGGPTLPDASTDPDASVGLGECVDYTPAVMAGTVSGSFVSGDEVVKIALPQATDVGGGLLKVTFDAHTQPMTGSIWLGEGAYADEARVNTSAFGPGVGESRVVVYFRLAGNKSYEIGLQSFSFSDSGVDDYTVTYSYEPQFDCYEANDTRGAAKRIPVNTTITASLHGGIGPDDRDTMSTSGDDWYTFELKTPKRVQLRATLPGKDGPDGKNSAMFTILEADGVTPAECGADAGIFDTDPVSATEDVQTCEGTLPAGTYVVKLGHFVSQWSATDSNVAPHSSWTTPYTFVVSAE